MSLIIKDINKCIAGKNKFKIVYTENKDKAGIKEDLLLNTRTEQIKSKDEMSCIYTEDGECYLFPKNEDEKYISKKGKVSRLPKDVYLIDNWLRTSSSDTDILKMVGDDYVITDKFHPAGGDDELTLLAKNVMNQVIPIVIKIQGKSDKTWLDARMKEIEKNSISAKMFLQLCQTLNLHVDMRVYREEFEGEEFIEQKRKLI